MAYLSNILAYDTRQCIPYILYKSKGMDHAGDTTYKIQQPSKQHHDKKTVHVKVYLTNEIHAQVHVDTKDINKV